MCIAASQSSVWKEIFTRNTMLGIWIASLLVFVANPLIDLNVLELFAKSVPLCRVSTRGWD